MKKLAEILREKGLSEEEIGNICGKVVIECRKERMEGLLAHEAMFVAVKRVTKKQFGGFGINI